MAKSKATPWLTEEGLLKVEGWARSGLTDKEIASKMGVSYTTLKDYKVKYPSISSSIAKGKADSLELAERMVFEHIRGFEYDETETSIIQDGAGNTQQKKVTRKKKKALPNDRMLQFYLRNRYPDEWNGKGTIEMERLRLENEKLRQQLDESEKRQNSNRDEEQRLLFEQQINDVMVGYIERLEGWFGGNDEG